MRIYLFAFFLIMFSQLGIAQQPYVYDRFQDLEARLKAGSDTIYIVNFWATWCKPCVEELPVFETFAARPHAQPTKVLLVSLDFKSHIGRRVTPFIAENNLQTEVIVLADQDTNTWMAAVSQSWDGAIPATWVVRGDRKVFAQKQFKNAQELEALVQQVK